MDGGSWVSMHWAWILRIESTVLFRAGFQSRAAALLNPAGCQALRAIVNRPSKEFGASAPGGPEGKTMSVSIDLSGRVAP